VPAVDGESVDAGGGGYDVDDSVDGAYLVEVNFFNGNVVDFGFGGAEEFEGVDCGLLDSGREGGGLNQIADYCERAAVGVIVVMVWGVFMWVLMSVTGFVLVLRFGLELVRVGLLLRLSAVIVN
jgi:hypothetical protein